MDGRTRFLIIASLVVNLFLAGALIGVLVVGAKLVHDRDYARRVDDDRAGARNAFQAIPPERRRELARLLRQPAVEAAPDLRASREARRHAAELIAAPNYDAAAVEAALKQARDREFQARAKIDAALASRLAQLSPQERAGFGQMMVRGPRGFDRGRDRDRDGDRDRRGDGPSTPEAPPPSR
jgi:uncharacterized membrane protein